jgi:hypothetical protein
MNKIFWTRHTQFRQMFKTILFCTQKVSLFQLERRLQYCIRNPLISRNADHVLQHR